MESLYFIKDEHKLKKLLWSFFNKIIRGFMESLYFIKDEHKLKKLLLELF